MVAALILLELNLTATLRQYWTV